MIRIPDQAFNVSRGGLKYPYSIHRHQGESLVSGDSLEVLLQEPNCKWILLCPSVSNPESECGQAERSQTL